MLAKPPKSCQGMALPVPPEDSGGGSIVCTQSMAGHDMPPDDDAYSGWHLGGALADFDDQWDLGAQDDFFGM